jgi:hypothetical protein
MLNDGHFGIWLDIENIKKKPQSETTIMPLKVKKLKLTLSDFFILSQKFFFFFVLSGQLRGNWRCTHCVCGTCQHIGGVHTLAPSL